jgi:hypothetical protein
MSRILRHPAIAACFTMLLIVAGGVGSIYSVEIRRAIPFNWSPRGRFLVGGPWSFSPQATIFWALVLISALIFYFRQRADDRARDAAQNTLVQGARTLEQMIRTMPPPNFLGLFAQLYNQSARIMEDALNVENNPDRDDYIQGARRLLQIIATLAWKFDGDDPGVHYAANIMLVKFSGALADVEKPAIRERLVFCDQEVSLDDLLGVLDLDLELSTTAPDPDAQPDAALTPMALPLPVAPQTPTGYRVLPGAPMAYFTRQADGFSDTAALKEWCETEGDFTQAVKANLEAYFLASDFKSFFCIPLFSTPDPADALEEPIAILNIHCDRLGLLTHENEPASHFVSLVRPFQLNLGKVVRKIMELDAIPENLVIVMT